MKKIKRLFIAISLFAAAGLTWTVVTLKNMPETFDWEVDDNE
jgi:hypothetical protein